MKKTALIFFFISWLLSTKAHTLGFLDQCDKIPLPNCTLYWNAITSTDSALYVVGNTGNCFIYYHKGGIKPINTGSLNDLTGVQFINNTVGYIWGTGGTLLKTSNGGIDWTPITTDTSSAITKVQFIDENTGYLMVDTVISKTINGGITWTRLTMPATIAFKDFYFFDSQNGQICGNKINPSLAGYLYTTTDGGLSWNLTYTATCGFTKLFYTNSNNGYLYGTTNTSPLLLQTTDAGLNWATKYNNAVWSLATDVVDFGGKATFVSNENTGAYMYGTPSFLDPNSGVVASPLNIYASSKNGIESLYIIASNSLYRYVSGGSLCKQIDFINVSPNTTNPYNSLKKGRKIRFRALVYNAAHDTIVRVEGNIKCSSPYVTITDSTAVYNNVLINYGSWSADTYELELSPNTPDNYVIHLQFSYENRIPATVIDKSIIDIPLIFSPFIIDSTTVIDSATANTLGNGNGIIEPQETAQITPIVIDTSVHYFYGVSGYLHSNFNYIYIWNYMAQPNGSGVVYNHSVYGSFSPGTSLKPTADFVFTDTFALTYQLPLTMVLKGQLSTYADEGGCVFQDFGNINYCWEIDFVINKNYALPPDSLRADYQPPINSITGIKKSIETLFSIYPNPGNGLFTLKTTDEVANGKLEVFNLLGEPVYTLLIKQDNNFKIDITDQPSGLYFLRILSDKTKETIKIFKN